MIVSLLLAMLLLKPPSVLQLMRTEKARQCVMKTLMQDVLV